MLILAILLFSTFTLLPYSSLNAQPNFPTAGTIRNAANLRGGPGTNFDIINSAAAGDVVTVIDCNSNCDWYELSSGSWIAAFLVELSTPPAVQRDSTITVVGWNTELNDADIDVLGERIAAFQDVDLWGLSEVNQASAQQPLEAAAAIGEKSDYASVLGQSGGGDRLLAIYDETRFTLLDSWEEDAINTTGNARAPLVLHLRDKTTEQELLFMVNHLYRSRDDERHKQAELLNSWAEQQTLPVIAVGDYNFDLALTGAERDAGYDLLTADSQFIWVQPETLVTTQCSGWPCTYHSVLDFVFTAGMAQSWRAEAEIVVVPGDFPDDASSSDHRPVLARFWPDEAVSATPTQSVLPTAAPIASGPIANSSANLRSGPGTTYSVAGSTQQGETLRIIGRNQAGDWYQLENGAWLAAFLVTDAPASADLPVVAAPTPPPTATPMPAAPTATAPAVATVAPSAPSGSAAVVIQYVNYDGAVSRVESDEYAVIANIGSAAINLGGWRLNAGDNGQDFRFPGVDLGPGQSVRVYTNQVHPESGGFSFRSGKAIWNNKGDCGYLFNQGGAVVSEWCY